MKYFDAHCHVQFPAFDEDRAEIIEGLRSAEIGGLVVGCDLESSKKAVEFAEANENFWASIGLHPNHEADEWYEAGNYRVLAKSSKVVAIGECGLDYYRPTHLDDEVKRKQKAVFEDHLQLAAELNKPLVIHARPAKGTMDAYEDALDIFTSYKKEHPNLRADFHFFVGDIPTARRIFELDSTISYTAVLTFTHDYDEVVRFAPLESLLSETDSPYVAPASRRGQRNDPRAVIEVVRALAQIRGEEEDTVREAVLANAKRLFSLP